MKLKIIHLNAIQLKIMTLLILMSGSLTTAAEDYPATIHWAQTYNVAIPLTGIIKSVEVNAGEQVTKGQTLVTLDNRAYRATVNTHTAMIQNLQGTYDEVQREFLRAEELFDRTVLSTTEMQQAEVNLSVAEANLLSAKASLEKAQIELSYTTIKAPFSGTVISRHINPGEVISLDTVKTLLTLIKNGQFMVRIWVPEKSLHEFTTGQKLELKTTTESHQLTVTSVGLAYKTDNDWTLFAVEGTMTANENNVLPGMQATISIP